MADTEAGRVAVIDTETIFGQLKAAKQEASNPLVFIKAALVIFFTTICCTICIGMLIVIPVASIVIGAVYLKQCPCEKYIPIYLIVAGVFGCIRQLSSMGQRTKNQRSGDGEKNAKPSCFDTIIDVFILAWFIAGSVWIYSIYDTVDTSEVAAASFDAGHNATVSGMGAQDCYCQATVYFFAFTITTATYAIMLLSLFCCCLACFCAMCCS